MFKAVIFDFFDVIHTDSLRVWLKKYDFKKEGDFAEASRLVDAGDIDEEGFIHMLSLASGISVSSIKSEFKEFATFDHDIIDLIKTLHKKYSLGLISNGGADYLRLTLKESDIESLFDEIIISAEVGMLKPDPKIFQLMLGKLKIDAKEAIFIDDRKENIEAAKSLGMFGILYKDFKMLHRDLIRLGFHIK